MELILKNFRCFQNKKIIFKKFPLIIIGPNGSGKTSFLEALYFLSTSKSFRTREKNNLIKSDSNEAYLFLKLNSKNLEVFLFRDKPTVYKINHKPSRRYNFINHFLGLTFWWGDFRLVYGSAQDRRRLINLLCLQIQPKYLEWLIKYKKVIKARNLALKKRDKNLVIIWSEKLAVIAEKIYRTRKRVIDEINKGLKKYVYFLGAIKRHEAKVVYEGRCFEKNSFLKTLLKRINLEFEIGFTTLGPHRDDVSFLIDKRKLISFSQGEMKIFLLILKLAFLGRIKNKLKIFMVDDWISGLDKAIIKKFAFLIKKQKIPLILTAQELVKGFSGQIINFKK